MQGMLTKDEGTNAQRQSARFWSHCIQPKALCNNRLQRLAVQAHLRSVITQLITALCTKGCFHRGSLPTVITAYLVK